MFLWGDNKLTIEQEKIIRKCEKLNNLLDKAILEGYAQLQYNRNKKLQRENKLQGVKNELSNQS